MAQINLETEFWGNSKEKILTGITASTEGGNVLIAHGLDGSKIKGFTVKVSQGTTEGVPNGFEGVSGYKVETYHTGAYFKVTNVSDNSLNVLSKPITIVVRYKD